MDLEMLQLDGDDLLLHEGEADGDDIREGSGVQDKEGGDGGEDGHLLSSGQAFDDGEAPPGSLDVVVSSMSPADERRGGRCDNVCTWRSLFNLCTGFSLLLICLLFVSMLLAAWMPWYKTRIRVRTVGTTLSYIREVHAFYIFSRCSGSFLCDSLHLLEGVSSWGRACEGCGSQHALYGSMWALTVCTAYLVVGIVLLAALLLVYVKVRKKYDRWVRLAVLAILAVAVLVTLLATSTVTCFISFLPLATENDYSKQECQTFMGVDELVPGLQPSKKNPCRSAFGKVTEKFNGDWVEIEWHAAWGWYWTIVTASLCLLLMFALACSARALARIYASGQLTGYEAVALNDGEEGDSAIPSFIIDFPLPPLHHQPFVASGPQLVAPGLEAIMAGETQTHVSVLDQDAGEAEELG